MEEFYETKCEDAKRFGELAQHAVEAQSVRFGRISGVVIIIIGIICAGLLSTHSDKPVFIYLLNAYVLFTPGIATMFLLGILWKRTTHAGALAAGVLTIPLSLVMELMFPKMPFFNRTGIVFWTCMIVCALVSLFTKAKSESELQGLIWNKESLSLPCRTTRAATRLEKPVSLVDDCDRVGPVFLHSLCVKAIFNRSEAAMFVRRFRVQVRKRRIWNCALRCPWPTL
jgi:hypothetical protein